MIKSNLLFFYAKYYKWLFFNKFFEENQISDEFYV